MPAEHRTAKWPTEADLPPEVRLESDLALLNMFARQYGIEATRELFVCPAPRIPVARGHVKCPICQRIFPAPKRVLPPHLRAFPPSGVDA